MAVGRARRSPPLRVPVDHPTGASGSDAAPRASQPRAVPSDGDLHAVAQPQLGQDPTDIAPDRGQLEDKTPGDLCIGQPVRDEPDDIQLAQRERVDHPPGALPLAGGQTPRHPALEDLPGHAGREDGVARGHGADRAVELGGAHVLEEEAGGARAQCPEGVVILARCHHTGPASRLRTLLSER